MVLSNKKLKQKLRASVAESLAAKEASKQREDASKSDTTSQDAQSFKQLLGSVSHKPILSKREIRRKKLPLLDPNNTQEGPNETTAIESSESEETKKKKKKRKRKADPDEEKVDGKSANNRSEEKMKKQKKKKKKRKKKKDEKNKDMKKKDSESGEGESKVEVKNIEWREVSQEASDIPTKVYVGGIPYYSTEEDIRSFFESCGTITEVDCMTFPDSGKFRGIAMIAFKTEAAAKRALALDGADMGGLFLKIQPYKATQAHKSSDFTPELVDGYNRIYVGNLSWDITEDDLRKFLSVCKISSIRFGLDKTTGEFRGYAHVDFQDNNSLMLALKLDQQVVCGRPVRIRCAVPKKQTETLIGSDVLSSKKAENDSSFSSGKKKRRTCYECGVPGHLSSSCPKKQAVVKCVEISLNK